MKNNLENLDERIRRNTNIEGNKIASKALRNALNKSQVSKCELIEEGLIDLERIQSILNENSEEVTIGEIVRAAVALNMKVSLRFSQIK